MLPRSFPACLFDGGHRVEGSEITADPALSRKYPTAAAGWRRNVRFAARQYSARPDGGLRNILLRLAARRAASPFRHHRAYSRALASLSTQVCTARPRE